MVVYLELSVFKKWTCDSNLAKARLGYNFGVLFVGALKESWENLDDIISEGRRHIFLLAEGHTRPITQAMKLIALRCYSIGSSHH